LLLENLSYTLMAKGVSLTSLWRFCVSEQGSRLTDVVRTDAATRADSHVLFQTHHTVEKARRAILRRNRWESKSPPKPANQATSDTSAPENPHLSGQSLPGDGEQRHSAVLELPGAQTCTEAEAGPGGCGCPLKKSAFNVSPLISRLVFSKASSQS